MALTLAKGCRLWISLLVGKVAYIRNHNAVNITLKYGNDKKIDLKDWILSLITDVLIFIENLKGK